MTEYRSSDKNRPRLVDTGGANSVGDISVLDTNVLVSFSVAALSSDRRAISSAVTDALAKGITAEDIADFYIPALSRQMGDAWCKDEMSFAGVTIGVSRLQSLLRELGPAWAGDTLAQPDAATIMLVVAEEIYHTLGAMVLAGQLRRRGLSVTLLLDGSPEMVCSKLQQGNYDAVFLSASIGESLETLRKIVEAARTYSETPPPIVIGGTILENEVDICAATGATYASKDLDEAIALCGLKTLPLQHQKIGR